MVPMSVGKTKNGVTCYWELVLLGRSTVPGGSLPAPLQPRGNPTGSKADSRCLSLPRKAASRQHPEWQNLALTGRQSRNGGPEPQLQQQQLQSSRPSSQQEATV